MCDCVKQEEEEVGWAFGEWLYWFGEEGISEEA